MNCMEVRQFLIPGHGDDELTEEKRKAIVTHLNTCVECEAVHNNIKVIKKYFEGFREITPPESVWRNIRNEVIKKKGAVYSIFWRLPALKFALPIAIFLIIISIFVLRQGGVKHENSLVEFIKDQTEFIASLDTGDTSLYEPFLEGEN